MDMFKIQRMYFGLYENMKRRQIKKHVKSVAQNYTSKNFKLTEQQEAQTLSFYVPYYKKADTTFHRFYTEKTGVFSPYYLPTDIYLNMVDEYYNNRQESQVMDNKCYYPTMFNAADILQPKTVALRMNGFWYDENMRIIDSNTLSVLLNQQTAVFVKKATRSCGGKGVLYIESVDGELCAQVMEQTKSWQEDIIIQLPVKQHQLISAINESSVNTFRIISLLTNEGVKIYTFLIRMGRAGAKVDNASGGGIACGVTDEGCLKKYAYSIAGERFDKHPTSGLVFEGYKIPGVESAKQLVQKAHTMLPHFRLVTWDVAVDENGDAVLIEANLAKGGIEFPQLTNGPLFGEDTPKILDEVFGKK